MKIKRTVKIIALLALCMTMLFSCAVNPLVIDLDSYFENKLPALTELGESVKNKFDSITGNDAIDDAALIAALENEIIPDSDELLEKAKAVATSTEELTTVHSIFIDAMATQNSGYKKMLAAVKQNNTEMINEAKALIEEAQSKYDIFVSELNALAGEYGWKIE